jgi:hypothetical protein
VCWPWYAGRTYTGAIQGHCGNSGFAKSGVDHSKIRYRGMTAIDFAKRVSDDELMKALKHAELTA